MRAHFLLAFFSFSSFAACVHTTLAVRGETLKPAAEAFHQSIRWRDFKAASGMIVPERRTAFDSARRAMKDEKDLTISDYQLDELKVAPNGEKGWVTSHVSWV